MIKIETITNKIEKTDRNNRNTRTIQSNDRKKYKDRNK